MTSSVDPSSLDLTSSERDASASQDVQRPEQLLFRRFRRPNLSKKMMHTLLARRYGSLTDFSRVVARWCDIARATGID